MNTDKFLKQIFTKYQATSVEKLYRKARDILLALEQKILLTMRHIDQTHHSITSSKTIWCNALETNSPEML